LPRFYAVMQRPISGVIASQPGLDLKYIRKADGKARPLCGGSLTAIARRR
jgi:hypothetical protein